jgi:hypothetical protein
LASPAAALQAIDGYKHVGPLQILNQPVKEVLIIMRSGFQIFFKDVLRFAHGPGLIADLSL